MESLNPAPSSTPTSQNSELCADSTFAQSMGFVVAYLRAVESARKDRIIDDPFAEPLTRKEQPMIKTLMSTMQQVHSQPETVLALRTRYLDEELDHRDPRLIQIVILGAGLDARAYRLESLRGCHVLEIDHSAAVFEHKSEVMRELHAPQIAKQVDCIVCDLAEVGLEGALMGRGFNPSMPTFWIMEGLLPYMERSSIASLLEVIDYMSAPSSEFWADLPGQISVDSAEWGGHRMKYGEDDPAHGVLSEIPWNVEVQASLQSPGTHFGRKWTPLLSPTSKTAVPIFYVIGKKPIPADDLKQKMTADLDFED